MHFADINVSQSIKPPCFLIYITIRFKKEVFLKVGIFWEYKKSLSYSFRHSTKSEFDSNGDWENEATR